MAELIHYKEPKNIFQAAGRRLVEVFDSSRVPERQLYWQQRRALARNPQANIPLISARWLVDAAHSLHAEISFDKGYEVVAPVAVAATTGIFDALMHARGGIGDMIGNAIGAAIGGEIMKRRDKGKLEGVKRLAAEVFPQLTPSEKAALQYA